MTAGLYLGQATAPAPGGRDAAGEFISAFKWLGISIVLLAAWKAWSKR